MSSVAHSWLVVLLGVILAGVSMAAPSELQGNYKKPTINLRLFGDDLSMTDNERDEYAINLAAYAVKNLRDNKGSQASLDLTREIFGLALHLLRHVDVDGVEEIRQGNEVTRKHRIARTPTFFQQLSPGK